MSTYTDINNLPGQSPKSPEEFVSFLSSWLLYDDPVDETDSTLMTKLWQAYYCNWSYRRDNNKEQQTAYAAVRQYVNDSLSN